MEYEETIQWLEPEPTLGKAIAKKQSSLRRGRKNLWAKAEERRQERAAQKASLTTLFIFLFLALIYFGVGVHHGLK